jgi:hypothetical protein
MPEYLAPGVYVVEVEWRAKSIPGVPTHINDEELRAIALIIRERLARFSPQWTDFNDSDPGVTLLELFAFLTESLLSRATPSERGRRQAGRLAAAALALLIDQEPAPGGVLRYVSFFAAGGRASFVYSRKEAAVIERGLGSHEMQSCEEARHRLDGIFRGRCLRRAIACPP